MLIFHRRGGVPLFVTGVVFSNFERGTTRNGEALPSYRPGRAAKLPAMPG